jgi:hypothetical protein
VKIFIAPSILNDSFSEFSILGLKLFSFSDQYTSLYALLALSFLLRNLLLFLMGLTLYTICFFYLTAFNILSLFCVLVL